VPRNDPTLMFTNAGMVQFKNVFTGQEKRPYSRATTAQKCVRAGGKHNDLDNVGYTARHHTFFEMLGNFSFGDYFKERAIELAWNLITKDFGLAKDKLLVTVYSEDDERRRSGRRSPACRTTGSSASRPRTISGDGRYRPVRPVLGNLLRPWRPHPRRPSRLARRGWRPLHRDLEPRLHAVSRSRPGRNRIDLPRPSIDTGMGLERIAAVLQGKHDNYDIDLFRALIRAIAEA
jgi:alanyl-tRNA synthetase